MSFRDDIADFSLDFAEKADSVFVRTVELTTESLVEGSAISGAPGQPVGQYGPGYHPGEIGGALKASFITEFESGKAALISTNSPYAEPIEDGAGKYGPLHLRSTVGGFHSGKMTEAAFPEIVAAAVGELGELAA